MGWVILFLAAIVSLLVFWRLRRNAYHATEGRAKELILHGWAWLVYPILGFIALLSVFQTSTLNPGGSQYAQFERTYFCRSIADGRNVALPDECGRQAAIAMPGFQVSFMVNVLNTITYHEMLDVSDGQYVTLSARDGLKLDEGQVAAKPWPLGLTTFTNAKGKEVTGNMLDAAFFLSDGMGRKGPQATILPPGRYTPNTFLWEIGKDLQVAGTDGKMVQVSLLRHTIKPGFVGVIKSAIDSDVVPSFMMKAGDAVVCGAHMAQEQSLDQIKAVLVPAACRGVWKETLHPGDYFINERVYQITEVDTRVQNWTFEGGYTRRSIDLSVEDDGSIKQVPATAEIPKPPNAAGPSIAVKVEGWTVHQDVRLQARALPEYAALVVAAVGGLKEVEDRIIVPQVFSVLRDIGGSRITVSNTVAYDEVKSELAALNARLGLLKDSNTDIGLSPEQRASEIALLEKQIAGLHLPDPNEKITRPTRVLDFQNEREALQALVAREIQKIGRGAGIEIVNVTFGNADIPAELLVSRKMEQLAGQLRNANLQMRTAWVLRQATEAAKARSSQQSSLVTAQIKVETSKLGIESRTNDGRAEQAYLEALAQGQSAQANVLGPDRVLMFNIVDALLKHPEAINALHLPSTLTIGQGGGLDGLATILGGTKLFGGPATAEPPKK